RLCLPGHPPCTLSRLTSQPTGVLQRCELQAFERLERIAKSFLNYGGMTRCVVSIFSLFRIVKEHNTSQHTVAGML
ncbi:hypothetical protein, partial [Pantoea agglomerans]|uniref:hypothetical protein n=1 Tax=Enterobacter agglomerans TaxID=549 RepID=UPI001A92FA58